MLESLLTKTDVYEKFKFALGSQHKENHFEWRLLLIRAKRIRFHLFTRKPSDPYKWVLLPTARCMISQRSLLKSCKHKKDDGILSGHLLSVVVATWYFPLKLVKYLCKLGFSPWTTRQLSISSKSSKKTALKMSSSGVCRMKCKLY